MPETMAAVTAKAERYMNQFDSLHDEHPKDRAQCQRVEDTVAVSYR